MKTSRLLASALLLLWLAGSADAAKPPAEAPGLPAFGQDKPLKLPQVVEKRLDNGLTLWLIERRGLPLISIYLASRVGRASDPADRTGLSEVLTATLTQGTHTRTARQIAERLQALGGELSVSAGKDATWLGLEGLAENSEGLMDLLADLVRNASYPEGEVKLAVENELAAIRASRAQPEYDLRQIFYKEVFGDHPYARVNPDPEAVARITPAELRRAHRLRFSPDRMILVMVGDLDTTTMVKLARQTLGDWQPTNQPPPAVPVAPRQAAPKLLLLDRPGSVQSTILVGRPLPPAGAPQEIPLKVANTIFGGAFSSRLVRNIREDKGYTYSPHAWVRLWNQGGLLQVQASVRNAVTAATLTEIFYEMDRLATTLPTEEELHRAQRYLEGHFLLDNETGHALAGTLVDYWIEGKTPADLERYVPAIQRVTRNQVRELAARWFASRRQAVAISGAAAEVKDQLEPFGPVEAAKAP